MKLKTKLLLSMIFLGSMLTAMSTVGAVRGGSKKDSAAIPRAGKISVYAGKTKHDLTGREALECIVSLMDLTAQESIALDQKRTTIWHILVAKEKWHAIRCLLGTDGRNLFAKEVVELYRESFVGCVNDRRSFRRTPLALAKQKGTVASLKGCVPSNLPEQLKRKLPPVLNTIRP